MTAKRRFDSLKFFSGLTYNEVDDKVYVLS